MEEAEVLEEEAAPPTTRKPRGTGKKIDHNAGLRLIPELNFLPDGRQPLKEFLEAKKPKTDMQVTLAMVFYMQHVMEVGKIGPSHVMTAYKIAGIPVPGSIKQTLRNVKSKQMWLNFDDLDDVKTTTLGENFIEHEMGKSGKSE